VALNPQAVGILGGLQTMERKIQFCWERSGGWLRIRAMSGFPKDFRAFFKESRGMGKAS
jgi:hypothetical protein